MSTAESLRIIDQCKPPHSPRVCMSCGGVKPSGHLDRYRYLDRDADHLPRPRVLVLCEACAVRIRDLAGDDMGRQLQALAENEPWPGATSVCQDCESRRGLECRSPLAVLYGGPGIHFLGAARTTLPRSAKTPSGRVFSYPQNVWGPATGCDGRRAVKPA